MDLFMQPTSSERLVQGWEQKTRRQGNIAKQILSWVPEPRPRKLSVRPNNRNLYDAFRANVLRRSSIRGSNSRILLSKWCPKEALTSENSDCKIPRSTVCHGPSAFIFPWLTQTVDEYQKWQTCRLEEYSGSKSCLPNIQYIRV